jgi:hypothetical protein
VAETNVERIYNASVDAYNAHDFAAMRSLLADDHAGIDHRSGALGRFTPEEFIAYTEGLFAQVRTQHLATSLIATRGHAGFFRTFETAETLDGAEIAFETLMVVVASDGKLQRTDFFDPADETEARALFQELAAE